MIVDRSILIFLCIMHLSSHELRLHASEHLGAYIPRLWCHCRFRRREGFLSDKSLGTMEVNCIGWLVASRFNGINSILAFIARMCQSFMHLVSYSLLRDEPSRASLLI